MLADLSPLRLRGLKGGDYRGGAEYKIHAAINDVRDAIDDAAGGSKPVSSGHKWYMAQMVYGTSGISQQSAAV